MGVESFGIWSLLPPVTALALALWRKQIYPALLLGVWVGWLVLDGGNPLLAFAHTLSSLINVFQDAGNTRIIFYSLLVGSVLALINASGGVEGFVAWMSRRHWVTNSKQAQLVPFFLGIFITVESSITSLIAGTVGRPLTDQYRVSREKLAYICDSTSAPICILVPFNGWGAMIIGLLMVQGIEAPVATMLASLRYNFYPMLAIAIVLGTILFKDYGPMQKAQRRADRDGALLAPGAQPMVSDDVLSVKTVAGVEPSAAMLVVPVAMMVVGIIAGLFITGAGASPDGAGIWEMIQASSGSTAVLWAVVASLVSLGLLNLYKRGISGKQFMDLTFRGMGGMIPVVSLLVLAFALGQTVKELGTGIYVAEVISGVASVKGAVMGLFLLACIMAFATGTSWGTFALMIPIAVPLATAMGADLPLFLAAVLGGGVFGDHCSPISDTSIISSMAAASDHIDHVRTQIPYALVGAAGTLFLYLLVA